MFTLGRQFPAWSSQPLGDLLLEPITLLYFDSTSSPVQWALTLGEHVEYCRSSLVWITPQFARSVCTTYLWSSHIQKQSMDQPGRVVNPARGQRKNGHFPVPVHAREFGLARRIRPSRSAPARSISILRLNLVLTHGIRPDFRGGVHFLI